MKGGGAGRWHVMNVMLKDIRIPRLFSVEEV